MNAMGSAKKKKKAGQSQKTDLIRIRIQTAKPGSKKYTHVDWNELLRENGKQRDEDELKRFYDEDTLFMAKKLAETKSKSGKRIRVNLDEIQHMNRNCGYDMDDDFIDDTEAVDDAIFTSKKGGFYAGKGNLKDIDEEEDEEEEESDDDMPIETPKKKTSKKEKSKKKEGGGSKSSTGTSSDSESDADRPQRLTGGPPTIRMAGGPPKRPAPGVRPLEKEAPKLKKAPEVATSSSSSGDVICLDDEPPAKKKALGDSKESKPMNSSTKGSTVTILAKKICKEMENGVKPTTPQKPETSTPSKSSTPSGATPTTSGAKDLVSEVSKMFEKLKTLGKLYQEKKTKEFDTDTFLMVGKYLELMKANNKITVDPLIIHISSSFGIKKEEVIRLLAEKMKEMVPKADLVKENAVPSVPTTSSSSSSSSPTSAPHEQLDWKLTQKDMPSMNSGDLQVLTTIVKSWIPKKKLPHAMLMAWVKKCNHEKMTADQARAKFYEIVQNLPDVNKPDQQNGMDIPKHERSRKARMFLHQWVYLSRKYVEMILPGLRKKPTTAEGLALKQLQTVNALKEALKKQIALFENKKDRLADDAVYVFQFSEPVLAAIHPYLEDLTDYALSIGKLETVITGIDTLHQAIDNKISQIQFYIEICRRLQKLSFLTTEEPLKTRLKQANEHISKHQVVQNPKYQIKWPGGEEPSLRGLHQELHDFTRSVLVKAAPRLVPSASTNSTPNRTIVSAPKSSPVAPKPVPASSTAPKSTVTAPKPSTPSTSNSGTPGASSGALAGISDEILKQRLQAMSQLVQVKKEASLTPLREQPAPIQRMTGRPPF